MLVFVGVLGWWLWDHFLRTSAYALVEVDEIHISAPLTGLIESMSVKEDGEYEAGTTVFAIVDRETRDELEALQLQLRLVESRLVERGLDLKLSRADRLYERDALIAERRADLGKARFEREKLGAEIAELSAKMPLREFELSRVEELAKDYTASEKELVTARAEYEAVSKRLARLMAAQEAAILRIEALRGRSIDLSPKLRQSMSASNHSAEKLNSSADALSSFTRNFSNATSA